MTSTEVDRAVELARRATGAGPEVPATAVAVDRLDHDGGYLLVRLGRDGEAGWVAAVDVAVPDVMSWAANPSGEPTIPPSSAPGDRYVWAPSGSAGSPLYPLLESTGPEGTRYRDLSGPVADPRRPRRG
ncbi:hypothetical protein D1871_14430 [Nakamurella silvestris]|nr:hypothetical protein D1871_14430 [Nakamurella silvestris]